MAKELKIGDAAPSFSLPANGGRTVSLTDYAKRKLVIYFYPKDNTPGCTTEAIDFTAAVKDFDKANTDIVGVSADSVKKHETLSRNTISALRFYPTNNKICLTPMVSGSRKACMAANSWVLNEPLSSSTQTAKLNRFGVK